MTIAEIMAFFFTPEFVSGLFAGALASREVKRMAESKVEQIDEATDSEDDSKAS